MLIYVWEGELWLTQEGDRRDRYLGPGGCFRLDRDGVTLAQAIERSTVSLTAPQPELYAKRLAMTKAGAGIQVELYSAREERAQRSGPGSSRPTRGRPPRRYDAPRRSPLRAGELEAASSRSPTRRPSLGDTFTRDTEQAWRAAYRVLANAMQANTEEKAMQVSPQHLDTPPLRQVHRGLQAHPLGHRRAT